MKAIFNLGFHAALAGFAFSAEPLVLKITPNGSDFNFVWNSRPGKHYDLLASTDLATPVPQWPVYQNGATTYHAIPSAGAATTLIAVPSSGPRRFFALREYDAPPPTSLLSADFEDNGAGFTVSTEEGSPWVWGTPTSTGLGGTVNAGNDGSAKCWGTDIGNPGFYQVPTTTILRSPVINMTAVTSATLEFAQAIDIESGDTARVFLVNADTNTDIGGAIHTSLDGNTANAAWTAVGPINISAGAGLNVRIEWRFSGQAEDEDYMGWYIDDVVVTNTSP